LSREWYCLYPSLFGDRQGHRMLLPLLIVVSYLLIIVFLVGFLPATFIKYLRPSLGVYCGLMSHALGLSTWLMSFFYVMKVFGFLGIFFAFLFQFLAPIAVLGAILKGSWHMAGHLLLWISFTYVMRFYSHWLLDLNSQDRQKGILSMSMPLKWTIKASL